MAIVKKWNHKHMNFQKSLSSVAFGQNDSLKQDIMSYEYLRLDLLFGGEPLIDEMTHKTA